MDAAHPHDTTAPATTRVMNLASYLPRNARQFPERPGLIWGERRWTWREMEAAVSALPTGPRRRAPGSARASACSCARGTAPRCALVDVRRLPARRSLGPDARPSTRPTRSPISRARSGAKALLCQCDCPAHAEAVAAADKSPCGGRGPSARARSARKHGGSCDRRACGRRRLR